MSSGAPKVFEWLVIFFEVLTNKKTKALLFILEIILWRLWGQKLTLECLCDPFQCFFICFLSLFIVRVFKTWELDQIWSVYSKDLSEMDLLCTECAKVFAKEVDLIAHQARAHDTRHFTCTECQAFLVGKDQQRNHMRQHMRKEKSLSIRTCTLCPYETRFKHNLNRHTAKAHTAKEKEPKATKACPECGKSFPY